LIPPPITTRSYSTDALIGWHKPREQERKDAANASTKARPRGETNPASGSARWMSGADLAAAAHDVLVARELGRADRPARVDLARRDADLGAHAELAAVGELRRSVVHEDRAVELVEETRGGRVVRRHDRVRVRGAVAANVVDRSEEH